MRWRALPMLALAASALSPLAACDGKARLHTFNARFWNASEGCLESEAVIDVIDGSDPGECPRTQCWVTPAGDAYVTTDACDAPLDFRDGTHDPAPSVCADALEALAAGDDGSCGA
jgi:hypothetical protein